MVRFIEELVVLRRRGLCVKVPPQRTDGLGKGLCGERKEKGDRKAPHCNLLVEIRKCYLTTGSRWLRG